jgi:uncharacterized protein
VVGRATELREIRALLRTSPVVAILGPRQIGKTTLAREIARTWPAPTTTFDLEDPRDVARLADPTTTLGPLRGLVVIDEIQRRPELFPVLRVLADRDRRPVRFLLLGSASPSLLKQSSESLAGRIAYVELLGFGLSDVGGRWERLWMRGGYPRAYLARTDEESLLAPRPDPHLSMHVALRDLGLESIDVVHAGGDSYPLSPKIRALAISKVATELDQRR